MTTAIKKRPEQTIDEHPAIDYLRDELKEIEEYVDRYSLADAIREGSEVTDQHVGGWFDSEGNVCAMSAAYLAAKARGVL